MSPRRKALALCLIALTSPDGSQLWIESHNIVAIRAAAHYQGHVAPGTRTLLFGAGGKGYGVTEDPATVAMRMRECER